VGLEQRISGAKLGAVHTGFVTSASEEPEDVTLTIVSNVAGELGNSPAVRAGRQTGPAGSGRSPGTTEHHHKCWVGTLAAKRNRRTDGLLPRVVAVTRIAGVGDTTMGRWRKSGKLPEPVKQERGSNLWHPSQVANVSL